MKQMDGKPNIAWDEQGNLLQPFNSLNVIEIINTLANKKGKFPTEQYPLIKLLFRLAQIPPTVIRNTTQKRKLIGGGASWITY